MGNYQRRYLNEHRRSKLSKCKFQKKRTSNLVDALTNYHAKYNETTQAFSNKPEHDWSSDYADAFRCFAIAEETGKLKHSSTDRVLSWGY